MERGKCKACGEERLVSDFHKCSICKALLCSYILCKEKLFLQDNVYFCPEHSTESETICDNEPNDNQTRKAGISGMCVYYVFHCFSSDKRYIDKHILYDYIINCDYLGAHKKSGSEGPVSTSNEDKGTSNTLHSDELSKAGIQYSIDKHIVR